MPFIATVLLMWSLGSTPLFGMSANDLFDKIIHHVDTVKKATSVIANLGLNCGTDPVNYALFQEELRNIKFGLSQLLVEMGVQLALKKDYPTICHVLTQSHIEKFFKDPSTSTSRQKCLDKDWFGTCLLKETITTQRPMPSYYWPTYFVEVTEKGNSIHPSFGSGNGLFNLNRQIASKFPTNSEGVVTLASFVLGNGLVQTALAKGGIQAPLINLSDLAMLSGLYPFEQKRLRACKSKTLSSYDVNIWPVALSGVMAEHFTVCGPSLKEQNKHPGGYIWAAKGLPTTCPVAMSQDAMHYWDTGILDYLDPAAIAQMVVGSNPLTCGAAALTQMGVLNFARSDKLVSDDEINTKTQGVVSKLRRAVQTCSWPITGVAEASIKKALSLVNPAKWSGPYCTSWGSLAPRMSTSVYNNDYSFANAGLKFKLLAHEMFGVPRGNSERWSLAYPWEGKGAVMDSAIPFFDDFKDFSNKKASHKETRSETLFIPGDAKLIDMSFSAKLMSDLLNPSNSNRRIYTVWEKISCPSPSAKITLKRAGFSITRYESCKSAIRYEVYKFIQLDLIRIICDVLGQQEGNPWL